MSDDAAALARREILWRRCAEDPIFASRYWFIQHPQGSRKWELYDCQREILGSWVDGKNHIHLKARQLGFSTSVGFFAWWVATFHAERKILLLSKGEREAAALLDKVKFGLDRLPQWLSDRCPKVTARTQTTLVFDNGSEIVSLPSASDPARSYTATLVVVDEMAFLNNQESAWASLEPVADIGGQIIGLSTANGVGNMFHQLWEAAVEGTNGFIAMFFGWWAVPGRDGDWYAAKRSSLLPWQLAQEYPSNAEEAFVKSGAGVFDADQVLGLSTWQGKRVEFKQSPTKSPEYVEKVGGRLTVWEWPVRGETYVVGADVAEGLSGGDFSSAHVLRVSTQGLVATWHGSIAADLFGHELFNLGWFYNYALLNPEVNNHGLTVVTELRRLGYGRLFRYRSFAKSVEVPTETLGFKTTRASKPILIDTLGSWLRQGYSMPCAETKKELLAYTRDEYGRMSGRPNDDRVMSLALATILLEYADLPEYAVHRDDYGTMAWVERTYGPSLGPSRDSNLRPLRQRMDAGR